MCCVIVVHELTQRCLELGFRGFIPGERGQASLDKPSASSSRIVPNRISWIQINPITTFSDGSLGSSNDEGRSKVR